MKINIIVSYSNNLVIGNDNERLWNYDEEKENFQKIVSDMSNINKKKYFNLWPTQLYKFI